MNASYQISFLMQMVFVVTTAAAQQDTSNRGFLLSVTHSVCRDRLLSEAPVMQSLASSGATMTEVCDCAAPLFVSSLSDAEVTEMLSHGTKAWIAQHYVKAEELCVMQAISAHGAR